MLIAPKIAQAIFAAVMDISTWKLGQKMYGRGSAAAMATVRLQAGEPDVDWLTNLTACPDGVQSVAMVYFHEDVRQLIRDYTDNCRTRPVALGLVP